jgi:hypothetical protein
MKSKLLIRITFSALIILLCGLLSPSNAQVVISTKTQKKSNPDIFFPNRKRTHPVIVRTEHNLPPGQEKKIYHEKSAKRFAPGQRKKAYDYNGYYNKNRKNPNKKWQHHGKNKKHHDG